MRALVENKFSSFSGNVTFSVRNVDGMERGGGRGHRGGSRGPALHVQNEQDQSGHKKGRLPAGDVDAPELRKDAALREIERLQVRLPPALGSAEHGWGRPVGKGCSACLLAAYWVAYKVVCRHRYH